MLTKLVLDDQVLNMLLVSLSTLGVENYLKI